MELNEILLQIDSLKKEAEGLLPVKPELERVFWDKFRLEFNYNSNHMEGNTLTYGQTQLLLLFDRVTGDNKGREIEEMKAHDVALKMIKEVAAEPENELNEKLIREINELILVRPYYNKAQTPDGKETKKLIIPGEYKKYPNHVLLQDGEMFFYASPEDTPALMGDLVNWYRQEKDKIHPIQLAALFHYKLVRIHPFDDSNGRTTRLMMNYIFMRHGYAPIVIESKKKEMYLTALNKADVGDINAFVDYIVSVSVKWQEIYLKAIRGEKIEDPDDFEKEIEILKKSFSNKQTTTQIISEGVVLTLFNNSIIKLFEAVFAKVSLLRSFSHSAIIRFGLDKNYLPIVSSDLVGNMVSLFLDNKDRIIKGGTIDLQYILKGITTQKNEIFDIYSEISVRLKEYTFCIETEQNGNPILEKKYGEQLSDSEIEEIALRIAKKSLARIKG